MDLSELREAALDRGLVEGLTHDFYRYPARFSPIFAGTAIREFSKPGDLVCDPYMGGGTTVVEALAARRRVIGTDINSLAVFIAKVKTEPLTAAESKAVADWGLRSCLDASYRHPRREIESLLGDCRTTNLSLPRARPIKKAVAVLLNSVDKLPTKRAKAFGRCVVLRTAQWALDNRKRLTSLSKFRDRFVENLNRMLNSIQSLSKTLKGNRFERKTCTVLELDARMLLAAPIFQAGEQADLVVTSPPYPGVHMLYHRWQVNGRRESPAPYWIADCQDGHGSSHYTFGDRRRNNSDAYFEISLATLHATRKVMRTGGYMVQMVAFSEPHTQLPRYLQNMRLAGFNEIVDGDRIRRDVPNRKWHATFHGRTNSSREVVLVHRAS